MMRQMAQQDVYALLGVKKDAKVEDIRRAYRKWAVKMHPDRNPGKEAESKFKEISAAYELLSNAESRKKYDSTHGIGVPAPPPCPRGSPTPASSASAAVCRRGP